MKSLFQSMRNLGFEEIGTTLSKVEWSVDPFGVISHRLYGGTVWGHLKAGVVAWVWREAILRTMLEDFVSFLDVTLILLIFDSYF